MSFAYNPFTDNLDYKAAGGGGGVGDVMGPASSTDNDIVVFDGLTGKIIKDTGISSIAPTFTGDVTTLSKFGAPYDTGAGEGYYFSDGTVAAREVGIAKANYFFGNSGNSSLSGIANTGVGQSSLASLTSGSQNTAMGNAALAIVSSGSGNSAYGYLAGQGITTGVNNNAFGSASMSSATGSSNNAFGTTSLQFCSGSFNTAMGHGVLKASSTGIYNTAVGYNALGAIVTGTYNVAIGSNAGSAYTGGEIGNILIGPDVLGSASESQTIRIGNTQSATYIAGINGTTVTGTAVLCATDGQLGTIASSERYKENIEDIPEFVSVMDLRPVMFNYKADKDKNVQFGLIAEEVDMDFPYLCFYKDGKPESVKYHELCVFLLTEVQRLSQRVSVLESVS